MKKKSTLIAVALILLVLVVGVVFFFSTRCEVYMCHNAKYEKTDYCKTHICGYTSWVLDEYDTKIDLCKNIAGAGGYCEEHICPVDECYNALVYNRLTEECGKLCNEHGCEFCGNKVIKTGATCCKEHKCAISGCTETIVMLGEAKYCSEHSCSEAGCYNVQVNGTEYCKEHKNASKVNTCKAENCNNEVEDGYCEEHACSEYRCIYPAVEGSDYCKEHKSVRDGNIDPEIGMSYEQVLKSTWGAPDEKNVDEYEWGVHAQWVYEDKGYIYFEDGEVVAIDKSY